MELNNTLSKQIVPLSLICHICGDVARGMNFDVMTCMSCKAFFRRNALQPIGKLRCTRKFNCEITKEKRRQCAACRLKKCFAFGMNPRLIHSFTEFSLSTPRQLNLLENDRSTLTFEQWNLLSNVIHTHDDETLLIRQKSLLDKNSTLPIKLHSKPILTSDYLHNCLIWMESLLKRLPHFRSLSTDARQLLIANNIRSCATFNGFLITRHLNIMNDALLLRSFIDIFGNEIFQKVIDIHKHLDYNDVLIKIFLFVMIFSSNCSAITSTSLYHIKSISSSINLIHIQDLFVTLLWKYLIYQYGLTDATLRYSSLVKIIVDIICMKETMSHIPMYDEMIKSTMKEIEHSLIIEG